jgi:diaminopropionate ammonia-lyase
VMAGLNCGSASRVALPDLEAGVDAFCAIEDAPVGDAVRSLLSDGLTCGETGAAGVAGLFALRQEWGEDSWARLGFDEPPAALAICTEAPTDPASFAQISASAQPG